MKKTGLAPTPIKNNRGYKEYTDSEVQYIKFITYLKRTEMPLSNIKEYIDFYFTDINFVNRKYDKWKAYGQ